MKKLKKLFVLVLVLSLVSVFVACDNKQSEGKNPTPPISDSQQNEKPSGQESTSVPATDTTKPDAATDTVTLIKENVHNYTTMSNYTEEMIFTLNGDTVIKCSIRETYEDEEAAKASEKANKDIDLYVNVTREGNIVFYDYSDEWCSISFELFKGKDMIIKHFTGEKGYTQQ